MERNIKLKPGMIIEGFTSDYSAIEQFKLVVLEYPCEYNPCTDKCEPLWKVTGRNGTLTRWYFEDEIYNNYWLAGTNNNIAYDSWIIFKY